MVVNLPDDRRHSPAHGARHNHQIRISPIRLIDQNDNQVGITSTSDALKMAHEAGLDLVNALHPRATIARSATLGRNVVVAAGAVALRGTVAVTAVPPCRSGARTR